MMLRVYLAMSKSFSFYVLFFVICFPSHQTYRLLAIFPLSNIEFGLFFCLIRAGADEGKIILSVDLGMAFGVEKRVNFEVVGGCEKGRKN